MPELPEVENTRLSLVGPLTGARVLRVEIRRDDVCFLGSSDRPAGRGDLLEGEKIASLVRHGKQMAIISADGRAVCVQLGMTGGLLIASPEDPVPAHTHVRWFMSAGTPGGPEFTLLFRDPRRFGGITAYASEGAMRGERWSSLGPDALGITCASLRARLHPGSRAIKAALLDQTVLAGVGNIYADEALFRAGVSPRRLARSLSDEECNAIARAIRHVLVAAVTAGGSSIRDYRHGRDEAGRFQREHLVYGRGGRPCTVCGRVLRVLVVAQRTTVMCPVCQGSARRKARHSMQLSTRKKLGKRPRQAGG